MILPLTLPSPNLGEGLNNKYLILAILWYFSEKCFGTCFRQILTKCQNCYRVFGLLNEAIHKDTSSLTPSSSYKKSLSPVGTTSMGTCR